MECKTPTNHYSKREVSQLRAVEIGKGCFPEKSGQAVPQHEKMMLKLFAKKSVLVYFRVFAALPPA